MININEIKIPKEVRYLSDCSDLLKTSLPQNSHYILDKVVTGCGATEYFIGNGDNIILCSPRKVLLQNKKDQHPEVFLVKNELEKTTSYDQDSSEYNDDEETIDDLGYITELQDKIKNYIFECMTLNKPCKILVTYDSFKHVLNTIISLSLTNSFQVVVDEFQSIFLDASFKAGVELNFVDYLQSIPSVCYLSATPILDKYIEDIDELKIIPYYKLIWDSSHIIKPVIYRKKVRSLIKPAIEHIHDYLGGRFFRTADSNGNIVESKEIVFYINSVTDICKIIKKANLDENNPLLTSSNTNIICSDTKKNNNRLKRVGFKIGSVPKRGEPHKMFTFCTRTVYLGADFYSTNAYTIIFSNVNIDCLALDISFDLPQILGRQRLPENLFRHEAILYYKALNLEITKEAFDKYLSEKLDDTQAALDTYKDLLENYKRVKYVKDRRDLIRANKYKKDFVGIIESTGDVSLNKLVYISEKRAWEVQQLNYKDDITLYNSLESEGMRVEGLITDRDLTLRDFFDAFFHKCPKFEDKIKLYCKFADKFGNQELKHTSKIPRDFHLYYEALGTKRIIALGCYETALKNELDVFQSGDIMFSAFSKVFLLGERYTKKDIKSMIQGIYDSLGLKKTAKAKDLDKYFNLRRCSISINKKECEGFEILSIK